MTNSEQHQVRIPRPADEEHRLAALYSSKLLDTAAEDDFNLLTEMAAHVCQTPFAFVSLVDRDRVWIKSSFGRNGISNVSRPRDDDYCSWAILEGAALVDPDLTSDPRSATISITVGPPGFRMCTGANLQTSDGYRIGTLCVLDDQPHILSEQQIQLLSRLARQVMALIELRAN